MGQPEIVKLLRKNKWASIKDISRELNVRPSSVCNSVRSMIRMPHAFGIDFKIGKRNKIFLRKR